MKRLVFVIVGTAALALAGCNRGNQDQVNNAELNQPAADALNEQANQAAMDAANAEAAAEAARQAAENAAAIANDAGPTDDDEQNVSGM
jgi:hypothetical protein